MHADKRRAAPFVVGTIKLDDGLVIRTLLTHAPDPGSQSTRLSAVLVVVPATDDTGESCDLRFAPLVRG